MKELYFKDVTSTNDMAKSLIKVGEYDILINAEFQSKGRGKQGAEWFGTRGKDLFLSFTLPCPKADLLWTYSVISCVGVNRVLRRYGFEPDIKAPNDLYIKGKKLCGILCEAEFFEKKAYMIVGVGINVFTKEFPEWLNATSLALEGEAENIDIKKLSLEIAEETRKVYKENFEKIQAEYNKFLIKL